jgi:hypothetical protein
MRAAAVALCLSLASAGPVLAQAAPDSAGERPGRFVLQPMEGGVVRLDTVTGAISHCRKRGEAITCEGVAADADLQAEVARLSAENKALKDEIKRLEEIAGLGDKPGAEPRAKGPKFSLPTEEDVDKALNYVERMLKKFRDRLKDFENGRPADPPGKGTPL